MASRLPVPAVRATSQQVPWPRGRKGFLLTPPGVRQYSASGTSSHITQAGRHPWVGTRESESFNPV